MLTLFNQQKRVGTIQFQKCFGAPCYVRDKNTVKNQKSGLKKSLEKITQ